MARSSIVNQIFGKDSTQRECNIQCISDGWSGQNTNIGGRFEAKQAQEARQYQGLFCTNCFKITLAHALQTLAERADD